MEVSKCWGFAGRKDELFKATSAPHAQERGNASAAIEPCEQHGTPVHACSMLWGEKSITNIEYYPATLGIIVKQAIFFGQMVTGGILLPVWTQRYEGLGGGS